MSLGSRWPLLHRISHIVLAHVLGSVYVLVAQIAHEFMSLGLTGVWLQIWCNLVH